jgi:hypothetical protein
MEARKVKVILNIRLKRRWMDYYQNKGIKNETHL